MYMYQIRNLKLWMEVNCVSLICGWLVFLISLKIFNKKMFVYRSEWPIYAFLTCLCGVQDQSGEC